MSGRRLAERLSGLLRSFACFEHVRCIRQWKPRDIVKQLEMSPNAKTHFKWIAREQAPSPHYLRKIIELEPTAKAIHDLPLWRLLDDESISETEINELITQFRKMPITDGRVLPTRKYHRASANPYPLIRNLDLNGIEMIRTDLSAYIETLALARHAEVRHEWDDVDRYLKHLFCILPYIGKTKWLQRDFFLLCRAVLSLYFRLPEDWRTFHPDLRIILGQQQHTNLEMSESWWMISETPYLHNVSNPIVCSAVSQQFANVSDLFTWYEMTDHQDLVGNPRANLGNECSSQNIANAALELFHCWRIPRHCWEPITGLTSGQLSMWLRGEFPPSDREIDTIRRLNKLARDLDARGFTLEDQASLLRSCATDDGDSPIDSFAVGQIEEAISNTTLLARLNCT